ncbi:MAG: pectinesterase family protein [Acidobacteriaceae bacterium]
MPKPCAILTAHIDGKDKPVLQTSHTQMDTQRIQEALQMCGPGEAVVLKAEGRRNAFLSAPLILPRGVTLFIDSGATLFASQNPRDYDLSPASCGAIKKDEVQCKPFLFSYQAAYSVVMGNGTIDGQGQSWHHGNGAKGLQRSAPDLVSTYESQSFKLIGITMRNAAGSPLAIYKTIGFRASDFTIDSPEGNAIAPGLLLSNSPAAIIQNAWIKITARAISIEASILGSTSHVSLQNIHIFGGQGISIGDASYGNANHIQIENATLQGALTGLTLRLSAADHKQVRDVLYNNICMQHVAAPLQVIQADGQMNASAPSTNAISFRNVTVEGKGQITDNGFVANSSAQCSSFPSFGASPKAEFSSIPGIVNQPGSKNSLVVAEDGTGDFQSIQQAVDALPLTGGRITIKPGTYREVVTIRKPHVSLHGATTDPKAVTIVYNNGSVHSGGTFNSATVFVEADNDSIDHLTISNDLGYGKGQAVALAVTGDRAVFRSLRILGHQDTLFAASKYCYGDYGPCVPARQYFADTYIDGNVDFIFGDSLAYFDHCELHGNANGNVMYTAQSRHTARQWSGYVFNHCTLTAEPRTSGVVSLGRPWRPYATVVYLHARIDANVIPAGWTEWPRFGKLSLPTTYYAEFQSTGPGANPSAREPYSHQLTAAEASKYSVAHFLAGSDGWNPLK